MDGQSVPEGRRGRRRRQKRKRAAARSGTSKNADPTPELRRMIMQGSRFGGSPAYIAGDPNRAAEYILRPETRNLPLSRRLDYIERFEKDWRNIQYHAPYSGPEMLKHYRTLTRVIDDLLAMLLPVHTTHESLRPRYYRVASNISALTWHWHGDLVSRYLAMSTIRFEELAFSLSWYSCFMRLYGIGHYYDIAKYDQHIDYPLHQHPFCKTVGVSRVACYRKSMQQMSMTEKIHTIYILYGVSHEHAISRDMCEYIKIIAISFGFICSYQSQQTNGLKSRDFSEFIDAELLAEHERRANEDKNTANRTRFLPLGHSKQSLESGTYVMKKSTSLALEVIMFSMMERTELYAKLQEMTSPFSKEHLSVSRRVAYSCVFRHMFTNWLVMSIQGILKRDIIAVHIENIFRVYLLNGEKRRYRSEKGVVGDSNTILKSFRADVYNEVNQIFDTPLGQIAEGAEKDFVSIYRQNGFLPETIPDKSEGLVAVSNRVLEYATSTRPRVTGGSNYPEKTADELISFEHSREYLRMERPWISIVFGMLDLFTRGDDAPVSMMLNWEKLEDINAIQSNLQYCMEKNLPFLCRHGRWNYVLLPVEDEEKVRIRNYIQKKRRTRGIPTSEIKAFSSMSIRTPFLPEALGVWAVSAVDRGILRRSHFPPGFVDKFRDWNTYTHSESENVDAAPF